MFEFSFLFLVLLSVFEGHSYYSSMVLHPKSVAGNDIPIGLLEVAWQSSELLTEMTKIMIEESLGYHARVDSRIGANGASPIYALAGCVDFDNSTVAYKQCLTWAAEAFSRSGTCRYSDGRYAKKRLQPARCGQSDTLIHVSVDSWVGSYASAQANFEKANPTIAAVDLGLLASEAPTRPNTSVSRDQSVLSRLVDFL